MSTDIHIEVLMYTFEFLPTGLPIDQTLDFYSKSGDLVPVYRFEVDHSRLQPMTIAKIRDRITATLGLIELGENWFVVACRWASREYRRDPALWSGLYSTLLEHTNDVKIVSVVQSRTLERIENPFFYQVAADHIRSIPDEDLVRALMRKNVPLEHSTGSPLLVRVNSKAFDYLEAEDLREPSTDFEETTDQRIRIHRDSLPPQEPVTDIDDFIERPPAELSSEFIEEGISED